MASSPFIKSSIPGGPTTPYIRSSSASSTPTTSTKPECIACIDVEVDGISPVNSSLRQLGIVVIEKSKFAYHTRPEVYTVLKKRWNIKAQDGKEELPVTMEWFRTKAPLVLEEIMALGEDIRIVMNDFATVWGNLNSQYCITNIVASPASVDYMWVRSLYSTYAISGSYDIPYKWTCLASQMDIVSEMTGYTYPELLNMFNPLKLRHSHFADDDALVQAVIYLNLRSYLKSIAHAMSS